VVFVMMQPSAPPAPPPPPPEPIRSQTREYQWPEASDRSAPTFAIVLTDGTVRMARTVCRQDAVLSYMSAEGAGREIEVSRVDREATRRANGRDLLE
jgi:hypothetical protein